MGQLIHLPGLKFHLFELRGILKCSSVREGKLPREYEFSDSDVETDDSDSGSNGAPPKRWDGVEASAVGLQMRLFKNDSRLEMEFEGKDGSSAAWVFSGMEQVGGRAMYASMGVQTLAVATKEQGMQTAVRGLKDAGSQVEVLGTMRDKSMQTEGCWEEAEKQSKVIHERATTSGALVDTGIQNDDDAAALEPDNNAQLVTGTKRKRLSSPAPPDKRARSTHTSAPWPRHLYAEGYRSAPQFKGDIGKLHIDLGNATVWYEGWYGKEHMRCKEKKQVDLRERLTKVLYNPLDSRGFEGYAHILGLIKPAKNYGVARIFEMHCGAPKLKIWGKHSATDSSSENIPFRDPAIIVDALVHCIDVTSGREAVHNPEADYNLETSMEEYESWYKAGAAARRRSILDGACKK